LEICAVEYQDLNFLCKTVNAFIIYVNYLNITAVIVTFLQGDL